MGINAAKYFRLEVFQLLFGRKQWSLVEESRKRTEVTFDGDRTSIEALPESTTNVTY
jgi:hypothetical protein